MSQEQILVSTANLNLHSLALWHRASVFGSKLRVPKVSRGAPARFVLWIVKTGWLGLALWSSVFDFIWTIEWLAPLHKQWLLSDWNRENQGFHSAWWKVTPIIKHGSFLILIRGSPNRFGFLHPRRWHIDPQKMCGAEMSSGGLVWNHLWSPIYSMGDLQDPIDWRYVNVPYFRPYELWGYSLT